jgi:hypothetical protein
MGFKGLQNGAVVISFTVACLAMAVMSDDATFTELFSAFSTDGYHVQVAPDGLEAKIVLDQAAGRNLLRFSQILALHVGIFRLANQSKVIQDSAMARSFPCLAIPNIDQSFVWFGQLQDLDPKTSICLAAFP